MNSLISPDNTWMLLSIMLIAVAVSVYLEQKYVWASKLSGAIIALCPGIGQYERHSLPCACF